MSDAVWDSMESEIEAVNELRNLLFLGAPREEIALAHRRVIESRAQVEILLGQAWMNSPTMQLRRVV